MMKKNLTNLLLLVLAAVLFTAGTRQTTIFIIGDSTAANKSKPETNPERGWGMAFQGFFGPKVRVDNHAVNGRSSKSFIDEGRWDKVLSRIKPGDYVLIQFGHNDEKPKPDRHTDPGTTFDENLSRYVTETRQRGGIPVLLNAVVRRNFYLQPDNETDDESLRNTIYEDEKVNSDTLVDTHGAYLLSPRNVAQKLSVPFIDANRITHDLEQGMGIEGSRKLHMWFKPGEVASIPNGRKDNTHYNVYGAHQVASLLADALVKVVPALKKHVRHHDYIVSQKGFGNYMDIKKAIEAVPEGKRARIYVLDGTWSIPKNTPRNISFDLYPGAKIIKEG